MNPTDCLKRVYFYLFMCIDTDFEKLCSNKQGDRDERSFIISVSLNSFNSFRVTCQNLYYDLLSKIISLIRSL